MVERPWAERAHYLRLNQTTASYFLILKRFDLHNKIFQDQAYPLQPTTHHSVQFTDGHKADRKFDMKAAAEYNKTGKRQDKKEESKRNPEKSQAEQITHPVMLSGQGQGEGGSLSIFLPNSNDASGLHETMNHFFLFGVSRTGEIALRYIRRDVDLELISSYPVHIPPHIPRPNRCVANSPDLNMSSINCAALNVLAPTIQVARKVIAQNNIILTAENDLLEVSEELNANDYVILVSANLVKINRNGVVQSVDLRLISLREIKLFGRLESSDTTYLEAIGVRTMPESTIITKELIIPKQCREWMHQGRLQGTKKDSSDCKVTLDCEVVQHFGETRCGNLTHNGTSFIIEIGSHLLVQTRATFTLHDFWLFGTFNGKALVEIIGDTALIKGACDVGPSLTLKLKQDGELHGQCSADRIEIEAVDFTIIRKAHLESHMHNIVLALRRHFEHQGRMNAHQGEVRCTAASVTLTPESHTSAKTQIELRTTTAQLDHQGTLKAPLVTATSQGVLRLRGRFEGNQFDCKGNADVLIEGGAQFTREDKKLREEQIIIIEAKKDFECNTRLLLLANARMQITATRGILNEDIMAKSLYFKFLDCENKKTCQAEDITLENQETKNYGIMDASRLLELRNKVMNFNKLQSDCIQMKEKEKGELISHGPMIAKKMDLEARNLNFLEGNVKVRELLKLTAESLKVTTEVTGGKIELSLKTRLELFQKFWANQELDCRAPDIIIHPGSTLHGGLGVHCVADPTRGVISILGVMSSGEKSDVELNAYSIEDKQELYSGRDIISNSHHLKLFGKEKKLMAACWRATCTQFEYEPQVFLLRQGLILTLLEGRTFTTPLTCIGGFHFTLCRKALIPLVFQENITVGMQKKVEANNLGEIKRNTKGDREITLPQSIEITHEADIEVEMPNHRLIIPTGRTWSATGRIKTNSRRFKQVNGSELVALSEIELKSGRMTLGDRVLQIGDNLSPASRASLRTNGNLKLESEQVMGWNSTFVRANDGLNVKAPGVTSISTDIDVVGKVVLDTPAFSHTLVTEICPPRRISHSGAVPSRELITSTTSRATTSPAQLKVQGEIDFKGHHASINASLVTTSAWNGLLPQLTSFTNTTHNVYESRNSYKMYGHKKITRGLRRRETIHIVVFQSYEYVAGTHYPAVLSCVRLEAKQAKLILDGQITAHTINFSEIEEGQLGGAPVQLAPIVVSQSAPLPSVISFLEHLRNDTSYGIDNILDSNGLYYVGSILGHPKITLPLPTILHSDSHMELGRGQEYYWLGPRQEGEIAIDLLLLLRGQGFLDDGTFRAEEILYKLRKNAAEFCHANQVQGINSLTREPLWAQNIIKPMLVYKQKQQGNRLRLVPYFIQPSHWRGTLLRDRSYIRAIETFSIKGTPNGNLAITARLCAGKSIKISRFNSVTVQKPVSERIIPTLVGTQTNRRFDGNIVYQIQRTALPGGEISAPNIDMSNINQLTLIGASLSAPQKIRIEKIRNLIERGIIEENPRLHHVSVRKKAITESLTEHNLVRTLITSGGNIYIGSDTHTYQSIYMQAAEALILMARYLLWFQATVVNERLPTELSKRRHVTTLVTGEREEGFPVQLQAQDLTVQCTEGHIKGQGTQFLPDRNLNLQGYLGVDLQALILQMRLQQEARGRKGLTAFRCRQQQMKESAYVTHLIAGENIKIGSEQGNVMLVAPVLHAGNLVMISAPQGDIAFAPLKLRCDMSFEQRSLALKGFGTRSFEALMQRDFKRAAARLFEDFPVIQQLKAIHEQCKAHHNLPSAPFRALQMVYQMHKMYQDFAKAQGLLDYVQGQILQGLSSIRLGQEVTTQRETGNSVLLAWLQARNIVMQSQNIDLAGNVEVENLTLTAKHNIKLHSAEERQRKETKTKGVSVGYSPTTYVNFEVEGRKEEERASHYVNSHLNVRNLTTLIAGDTISLKGVVIETLNAYIKARKLDVETEQSTESRKTRSQCVNTDGKFNHSKGTRESKWTQERTALRIAGTAHIEITERLRLLGASIDLGHAATPLQVRYPGAARGQTIPLYAYELPDVLQSLNLRQDEAKKLLLGHLSDANFCALFVEDVQRALLEGNLNARELVETGQPFFEAFEGLSAKLWSFQRRYVLETSERIAQNPTNETAALNAALVEFAAQRKILLSCVRDPQTIALFINTCFEPLTYLSLLHALIKLKGLNCRLWRHASSFRTVTLPPMESSEGTNPNPTPEPPTSSSANHLEVVQSYVYGNEWLELYDNQGRLYALYPEPGHIFCPNIEVKHLRDTETERSRGFDVDVGGFMKGQLDPGSTDSAIKGSANFSSSKRHQERDQLATVSGNMVIKTQSDLLGLNRDSSSATTITRKSGYDYYAFTLLGDPHKIAKEVSEPFRSTTSTSSKKQPQKKQASDQRSSRPSTQIAGFATLQPVVSTAPSMPQTTPTLSFPASNELRPQRQTFFGPDVTRGYQLPYSDPVLTPVLFSSSARSTSRTNAANMRYRFNTNDNRVVSLGSNNGNRRSQTQTIYNEPCASNAERNSYWNSPRFLASIQPPQDNDFSFRLQSRPRRNVFSASNEIQDALYQSETLLQTLSRTRIVAGYDPNVSNNHSWFRNLGRSIGRLGLETYAGVSKWALNLFDRYPGSLETILGARQFSDEILDYASERMAGIVGNREEYKARRDRVNAGIAETTYETTSFLTNVCNEYDINREDRSAILTFSGLLLTGTKTGRRTLGLGNGGNRPHMPNPHMGYHPAPNNKILPGFPDARPVNGRTPKRNGGGIRRRWELSDGKILEWDYQHGSVEMYSRNGKKHLGEFDPTTGLQLKGPIKNRSVHEYL